MFRNVVLIGQGTVFNNLITLLWEKASIYGYDLHCIEYDCQMMLGMSQRKCEEYGIQYKKSNSNDEVTAFFSKNSKKTLIISAENHYIFPQKVVENPKYTIINFHNALLPKYPGRNAPTWAIWDNEKWAGTTWHYVDKDIDSGNIIFQDKCAIESDVRAFELTKKTMEIAVNGLYSFFDDLIQEKRITTIGNNGKHERIYKSYEIPANGFFSLENDSGEKVYRLLRATDYGKSEIFPRIQTIINGSLVEVMRYKKETRKMTSSKARNVITEELLFMYIDEEFELRVRYKHFSGRDNEI